ncbi:VOC family protein [Nocardiopsis coralliicola]
MGSRIAVIAIDANDPEALAEFWSRALDWPVVEVDPRDGGQSLAPEPGAPLGIDIFPVPEVKPAQKNRLHLDLRATPGTTVEQELERLISLGARHVDVGQPDDAPWTVLADPEGNEFCLLHRPDAPPA